MESLCGKQCSRCNFYERCGGCSLCEASICGENCMECGSICPKRGETICKVLDLSKYNAESLNENIHIDMDGHIPILIDKLQEIYDYTKVIAIHGEHFFSRSGEKIINNYSQNGFRKCLNVDESVDGILEFYVKDRTLEGFWKNRNAIYEELKKQGLVAVIAPNFSVYEDAPRLEHIYNIKRSIIVYNELIDNDINAIPDISWFNLRDLEFWVEIIKKSDVKLIAFSFQVVDVRLKASNAWKDYLAGFKYLCKSIRSDIGIVIAGVASVNKIKVILEAADRRKIYFLNQSAYVQSQRGMRSEGRIRDISTTKAELFKINISYYNKLLNYKGEK